jgi:phage shock protein PspC (stress-responsive transcriptional regulator)
MNKTIIININGIVFHIEEDAYEILKTYMTAVKRHFLNAEDSLEITTDIENRIAEMFTEILNTEARQVIIEQDVNTVISQMGTVEDFETGGSTDQRSGSSYATDDYQFSNSRKLFRDPDDHLLGGVCAGVANYFDVEAVWVRLAFALALVVGGSGFILYLILWIVMPKAVTRADKMAMKGEKLDLEGFRKNFEDELKNVSTKLNNARNEARPVIYKLRDFIGDFMDHLGAFLGGTGRIILKLFAILIMLMCFGFGVSLIMSLFFALSYGDLIFPFSIVDGHYSTAMYMSAFFALLLPLVAIILLTIRVAFNTRSLNRSVGYSMLIMWLVALGFTMYYGVQTSLDFKYTASYSQNISLKTTPDSVYYLKLNNIKFLTREDSAKLDINDRFKGHITFDVGDEETRGQMHINIEKSDVPQPVLVESVSAHGANYAEALSNARSVTYYFNQKDSVLSFNKQLQTPPNSKWRNQRLELTLKIPLKSTVVIEEALNEFIWGLSVYDCKKMNGQEKATSAEFIMTENGLQCKADTVHNGPAQIPDQAESN